MQGLILRGDGRLPEACLLLYRVARATDARAWLAGLVPRLTTAASAPATSARERGTNRARDGGAGPAREVAESFPLEVREGMVTEHRQRVLGDEGENAPQHWSSAVRALPSRTAAARLHGHAAALAELVGELRPPRKGRPRKSCGGSRPATSGGPSTSASATASHNRGRRGRQGVDRAGSGRARRRARAGLPRRVRAVRRPAAGRRRQHDPGSVLAPDVEGSGAHDLGRNGSYLVLRQLEQDVPAFWRFADIRRARERIAAGGEDGGPLAQRRAAGAGARCGRSRHRARTSERVSLPPRRSGGPQLPGGRAHPAHEPAGVA